MRQTHPKTSDGGEGTPVPLPVGPLVEDPVAAAAHPSEAGDRAPEEERDHEHAIETLDLVRIGFVALAVAISGFHLWRPFPNVDAVALVATLIGGYPIFKEAFENIVERRMTMELSMTIALGAALAIGESFTALLIVLFVLIAEVIEGLTVGRGRSALKKLIDLLPRTALVRRGEKTVEVRAVDVEPGEIVLIKPGMRLPVDGIVVSGHSFIDQSSITGESMPVQKRAGLPVFAGTINQSGALEVRTTGIGRDTAFGKVIDAVEAAEKSRAPIQKTADQLAGYLVYFALGCALLTFLLTHNARSTISVIIVAGACGVAAGTPLAILGAIGRAAHEGAVIKGGLYLEILSRVDTIVFDKTGTLTFGNPAVSAIHPFPGVTEARVLEAAACVERSSEHPLAKAIVSKAESLSLPVVESDRFDYTPGKGVIGSVQGEEIVVGSWEFLEERGIRLPSPTLPETEASEVWVSRAGMGLGSIRIEDILRNEAVEAVASLRRMGLRTILLSGDNRRIAVRVGSRLGVDEVEAELLPEEKRQRVHRLVAVEKRCVAMVGDGINDAPALMEASVGVAMGSGTDVARESANIVLLGNDLLKFVETVRIARRARRIIHQNFTGTLVVDGVGVGLAAFGFLNPLLAVSIHVISELVFILNSARLLPSAGRGSFR